MPHLITRSTTLRASLSSREKRFLPVAAVIALLSLGCSPGEGASADSTAVAPTVLSPQDIATAQIADVATGISVTGSLEPAQKATIMAQVGGALTGMSVDRGSRVQRGQRVATIEAAGVRSQAAGAEAAIAAAEAQLAVARTQRDGQKRLYEAGAISRVQYENAEATFAAAEAQLAAAKAQAAAAIEAAGYTAVTSPLTGIVSDRPTEPGEAVSPGDPIMTVVNTTVLELTGRIPVDDAGRVRVGQDVAFRLSAFPGREFAGKVARKDPAADPSTRQVGIHISLPNPKGEITAGQYARGQVQGDRLRGAITVPITAAMTSGDSAFLFVVENGALSRRSVTLGPRDDAAGLVAVLTGLAAGERLLARPVPSLAAGQRVVVASDEGPAAQGTSPTDNSQAPDSSAAARKEK